MDLSKLIDKQITTIPDWRGELMSKFKGGAFKDTHQIFNAGLESKKTKAIDFGEKDSVNESNVKDLVREAIVLNTNG